MRSEEELRDMARAECLKRAQEHFKEPLLVEMGESRLEWDSIDLRHVFTQPMTIYRKRGTYEVFLDNADKPVGFIDPGKWEGCAWEPVSDNNARKLIEETGLITWPFAVVGSQRGERDCLELQAQKILPDETTRGYQVRINPAKRTVISIVPEQPEVPDDE